MHNILLPYQLLANSTDLLNNWSILYIHANVVYIYIFHN